MWKRVRRNGSGLEENHDRRQRDAVGEPLLYRGLDLGAYQVSVGSYRGGDSNDKGEQLGEGFFFGGGAF